MKKTGEKFKARREELGYSIQDISLSTKIASKTLEAIEQGNETFLPSLPYLRGFIRTYAKHLKLDPNEMIASFNQECDSADQSKTFAEQFPKPDADTESITINRTDGTPDSGKGDTAKSSIGYKILLGVAALTLLFVFIGTQKVIDKYRKEASLAKEPLQVTRIDSQKSPTQSKKKSSVSQPADKTSKTKKPAKKGQAQKDPVKQKKKRRPSKNNPSSERKLKKETSQKVSKTKVQVKNEKGAGNQNDRTEEKQKGKEDRQTKPKSENITKTKVETEKLTTKTEKSTTEVNEKTTREKKPQESPQEKPAKAEETYEIIVEATDHVEIKFQFGSKEPQSITLDPNQIHTFKSSKKVTLDISDGGKTKVFLNGKKYNTSRTPGKPLTLQFP